jgi:hypothetical protein
MGIKNYIGISALAIAVLSCKGRASDAPSEQVDTVVTVKEQAPATETKVDTVAQKTASDDGFPSTYEPPKGQVLEVLKDYNAHMSDYNTTSVEALGMGSQGNCILLNFSVPDIGFNLDDKEKLKKQARELIESMPIDRQTAWRCIPNEGYNLMVTFVGRQSNKIVSVVFTKEELKEML